MKLTEEQKEEVKNHIIIVPKFRETYNELYDHILNSLGEQDGEFNLNKVDEIVNLDFYGYYEVAHQEKIYQKELNKKYNRLFLLEMLPTFKWPQLINNFIILLLCYILYLYGSENSSNLKPLVLGSIIATAGIAVFGILVIISKRIKYGKHSILDNYLMFEKWLWDGDN